ncbi:hypothetical protein AB9P05_05390 [Roseivirga sp. BDSF3-8]|uniref:hypothetical protein n=1 Tax=Roseivirga sp. BDSF3-8 TaxID=3241598 RepID=UPI003531B4EA
MKVYKIKRSAHLRALKSIVVTILFFSIGLSLLVVYRYGYLDLKKVFIAGSVSFVIFVLPMLLLHLQYYIINRYDSFSYDDVKQVIIYSSKYNDIRFHEKDITEIIVYKTKPLAENRTAVFTWDEYNYALIKLSNNVVIRISCLLVGELDKILKLKNVHVKKTFYPWIT